MKKRLIATVLTAVMAISLMACGGGSSSGSSSSDAAAGDAAAEGEAAADAGSEIRTPLESGIAALKVSLAALKSDKEKVVVTL